jgi:hypothetical protein
VPFAALQVNGAYDLSGWWQIKATPVLLFESISIAIIFVVRLLGAATRDVELHLINSTTEGETLLNVSSIVSNNSAALQPAMKNGHPTSLP